MARDGERAERDGVILRALFIHGLKEARARPDLTERDQFEIMELEAEFVMRFEIFSITALSLRRREARSGWCLSFKRWGGSLPRPRGIGEAQASRDV